jgi:hypothetical protein
MPWIEIAIWLVAGVVTVMLVVLGRRPFDVHELGSVSRHWITTHREDSP